ncbi:hypothetical protein [Paenibacillus lautus]|uniref:hypothetical protein n=1 Tax=Paenibacillus lautus TaxID=1401 RepID=UPI003D2BEB43
MLNRFNLSSLPDLPISYLIFSWLRIYNFLGFCFRFGYSAVPAVTDEAYWVQSESPLMTLEQTAEFLNLTESQVKNIISSENALRGQGASEGLPFPYIVVQSEIYISKMGLISWLEELHGKEGCIDNAIVTI